MAETLLAIVLCVCTVTCAPSRAPVTSTSPSVGDRSGPPPAAPAHAQRDGRTRIVNAVPTTFEIALDEPLRQALARHAADRSLTVARLAINDVRPREARSLKGVRIFIEKPDATIGTSTDDPHYAGNFVLGLGPTESYVVNIAPALTKLWSAGLLTRATLDQQKAIRITFVSEPWDFAESLPADFALSIHGLELELPDQP